MDRTLLITWYDLPAGAESEHLAWAKEHYTTKMLERRGVEWAAHFKTEPHPPMSNLKPGAPPRLHSTDDASVPRGNAYISIFGARTPHAFSGPTLARWHEALSAHDREMLAQGVSSRVNLMIDQDRTDGPDAHTRKAGEPLSPCIQLGSFNAGEADEEEVLAWYAEWRFPSMQKLQGCVGIRKLVSIAGWAKHGVLYEFSSLEARNKYFPRHEDPFPEKEWTDRFVRKLMHAPGSPNVVQRIAFATAK